MEKRKLTVEILPEYDEPPIWLNIDISWTEYQANLSHFQERARQYIYNSCKIETKYL